MPRYKKLEVNSSDYEIIRENKISSGEIVSEQIHGSRKNLYNSKNEIIATMLRSSTISLGALTTQQFVSFLGTFQKTLYRAFQNNPKLIELSINFKGVTKDKDLNVWREMKIGQFFYNVDLNSAYWQMAHKLGYIDAELFQRYLNADDFKSLKRLCISFLARQNKKNYYYNDIQYTIYCDNNALIQVYTNIRNSCYEIIDQCNTSVPVLAYNIDSVYVLPEHLKTIKSILEGNEYKYKFTLCQKISHTHYAFGREKRKF
jgi:hypothetical protein